MIKTSVIDLTGNGKPPVTITLKLGGLNAVELRAIALAALNLHDIPDLTVEVLDEQQRVTTRISSSCTIFVKWNESSAINDLLKGTIFENLFRK
ncbi:MAG: hypothetical protein AAB601_03230 [Patescibacteria group bacterium]